MPAGEGKTGGGSGKCGYSLGETRWAELNDWLAWLAGCLVGWLPAREPLPGCRLVSCPFPAVDGCLLTLGFAECFHYFTFCFLVSFCLFFSFSFFLFLAVDAPINFLRGCIISSCGFALAIYLF